MLSNRTACQLVDMASNAVLAQPKEFHQVLDEIPAALYLTDTEGTLTYFNRAAAELAGRTPVIGSDKWCVTWRLYTDDGKYLPHDQCPMAVAIRERSPVRDVEAIAERHDGTRVHFVPYATPLFDGSGTFVGAVNLLLDVTEQRKPEYLKEQAARCRRLANDVSDTRTVETLSLMAAKYEEQALKLAKIVS